MTTENEKFTEEEYQKIVKIADKHFANKALVASKHLQAIYLEVFEQFGKSDKIKRLNQEVVLIASPKSREWAHGLFVEKGAKYYWRSKTPNCYGDHIYLEMYEGLITLSAYADEAVRFDDRFTEQEIIDAGYNPDMYERVYEL